MKLNTVNLLVGLVIAVSGVFYLGTYIVDKTQYAIEIRLGDAVDTVTEPGLEFKVPFITRIFYVENRIQDFDADPGSVFTKDKKEMIVDTYSKWRVEDPLKFYQTVRTVSGALARLDDIIYSQTREILGKHTLVEIVSGNRKEIRETITINSRKNAEKFGIEVIDVRIKRADLPQSNSLAVYGRMEAERKREAKRYRSEGNERALEIRSAADRDRIKILSKPTGLPRKSGVRRMQRPPKPMPMPTAKILISLPFSVLMMFIVRRFRKIQRCFSVRNGRFLNTLNNPTDAA